MTLRSFSHKSDFGLIHPLFKLFLCVLNTTKLNNALNVGTSASLLFLFRQASPCVMHVDIGNEETFANVYL